MYLVRQLSLAALCALGLLVSATGAQAQAMKLLPADTEMVFSINLQQMLKSDVVKTNETLLNLLKQAIDQQLEDKGVAKYFEKAKFDLFKDLSSVTVAVPSGRETAEGLVIIEGNFDPERLEAVARDVTKESNTGFKVSTIANVKTFEISAKNDKTVYIGMLSKKTIIVSNTKEEVAATVARSNGGKVAFKSESFKNLISTVSAKQSISFAATSKIMEKMSEKAPEGGPAEQIKQAVTILKQFDGFSGSLTIEKNIDFQVGANAKSKETATEYANLLKVGIGAAKAKVAEQAKNNEKFAPAVDIVNSLEATTMGANIVVRGQITLETLGKLLQNLPVQ